MNKQEFIEQEIVELEKQLVGEKQRSNSVADAILDKNPVYTRLMGIQDAIFDRIAKLKLELTKESDKIVGTDTGTKAEKSS